MQPLDEVFSLLTNERRRSALYVLGQADDPVHITDLAKTISDWECGSSTPEIREEPYDEVIITLKHSHLPKAVQAEFIDLGGVIMHQ